MPRVATSCLSRAVVVISWRLSPILDFGLSSPRFLASTSTKHQILTKSPTVPANLRNFPSMSHLISYLSGVSVLMWWLDAHLSKLSSYWLFGPPRRIKLPLQKLPQETIRPNYRPNCEKNTIGHQRRYILPEWKPRYRCFGLDGHTN